MSDLIVTMTKRELEMIIEERFRHCFLSIMPIVSESDNQPESEQLLTKKQAAKLIGVCSSTIDNHARAGNLTRRYIGKAVRFSRDEVLKLAQEKTPGMAGKLMLIREKRRE